ncbi:GlxA family transcriptional regulator [Undibacterium terreum]|uniref:AraC family transcriptional regulator n=1 Tax=Undibacterium terreum TaxID=1224302 RepID=A0A916XQX8_9BURK|nr:helix-turn-helix domain-containing protein [Undibacterium terreum]GGC93710.1 AraC family transcriptional regulator [Undibacterium terreum]
MLTVIVALYVCRQTITSSLCMAIDAFQLANQFHGSRLFQLQRVSTDGRSVENTLGSIQVDSGLQHLATPDIFIVPAVGRDVDLAIAENLELQAYMQASSKAPAKKSATQFASLCSGAFLLAAAGLLDGRRATTHWALEQGFRQRFPKVKLSIEALMTQDGNVLCSGGAQAGLDLCLFLIRQHGGEALARQVANAMVVELGRSSQLPYASAALSGFASEVASGFASAPAALAHGDSLIGKLQLWMDVHYAQELTLENLAEVAHCSPRTLLRRFNKATGYSPATYLQRLRVSAACDQLARGNPQVAEVAAAVGYQDRPAFAKMFKRITGQTPAAYKRQQQLARSGYAN